MPLPRIMVAPNGARLQKADHPAFPLTLPEIVTCAQACHAAGADGLHLHLRDADGGHLLDAGAYREALAELSQAVPELTVQITTEAVGIYEPDVQRDVALTSGASLVSASIRELSRDTSAPVADFYNACESKGIAIQHILYDVEDCALLLRALPEALLRSDALQLIYVLGRYSSNGQSTPEDLTPFTDWLAREALTPDWAICAFGAREVDCLLHAASLGGKCRIGFENSRQLRNGDIARDNAQKVAELAALLPPA
ncbi:MULTISPECIES: 3-keto-5-aminohexanoate cleavage protein [unclassified Marinovum]